MMNFPRVHHYDFSFEMEEGTFVQGIRWTPIADPTVMESGEGAGRQGTSQKLSQASRVLQKALLSASPNLLRDRKHFLRTLRRCCTGRELVDALLRLNPALPSRPQAVGVLQLLLEEGILINVKQDVNVLDKDDQFFRFAEAVMEVGRGDLDSEDDLHEAMNLLTLLGPDALLTSSLRKV
ncbi:rap guanine nucleotide exchange factor 3-like, partial [Scyliorhinus torazame]|uniref:rap guanine nucleotide exchange factor 3-like n=1 Tax=Scyliorhinus torazame TaxID=75743 RepID=UPI003B59AAA9